MKRLVSSGVVMVVVLFSSVHSQTLTRGSIEQEIMEIRDAMPGPGSNGFVIPTDQQMSVWAGVFTAMKAGNYTAVPSLVAPYAYTFMHFVDTLHAETLYVLKENIPVQRGWGTYILHPGGRNDLAVEIPHPRFDTNTCIMGIRAFLRLDAQWYFLAGTNRFANPDSSSDMAHVTQSIFYKGHTTVLTARALQLHGFDRTNPIYNGYPQMVISNGTQSPPAILSTLKANYETKGFTAGVFSTSTYSQLWRLGATTNVEGQWSNANGKAFVHVEHELPIRIDSVKMMLAIEALYETFTPVNSRGSDIPEPARIKLMQNYPNPFNPSTNITFCVPEALNGKAGNSSLRVFDLLGRDVATLASGEFTPGTHTIVWDAHGLASGVYWYRLTVGDASLSKRMLLMK